MSTVTAKLSALVAGLRGQDIEKMSEDEALTFKGKVMAEFASATSGLPQVFLGGDANFERLVWHVKAAEPNSCEWIGRFSLRSTDLMEANLDRPGRIAMAAAMRPEVELIVDLLGDFHYPGGLSVEPALVIAVRVSGEVLEVLEGLSPSICGRLQTVARGRGVELCVRTVEDAMDDQLNPPCLQGALRAARHAVVETAEAEGHVMVQAIEILLTLSSEPGLVETNLLGALASMGQAFTHCDSGTASA